MKQIETEKEKIYNHEIRIKSCFKNGWEKMNDSWKIENMIAEISIEGLAVKTQNKSKKGLKKKKKEQNWYGRFVLCPISYKLEIYFPEFLFLHCSWLAWAMRYFNFERKK